MRLYGKKIIRNRTQRQVDAKMETRDAIISQVYPVLRVADVKIQGSNTPIVAHYPLNWETTPIWLKKGNAAKINFVGGMRGRVELIGHGSTIPTPQPGGTGVTPTTPNDNLFSGGEINPTPTPSMDVVVNAGTVRINGEIYSFAITTVTIPGVCPNPYTYRYDLIVVGTDGTVEVVPGTPGATPSAPAVPSDHVEIGRILVTHVSSTIVNTNINATWTSRVVQSLSMTFSKDHMHWDDEGSVTITLTVLDQYGEAITPAVAGYNHYDFTLSWLTGNGTIDATAAPDPVTKSGGAASSDTFAYTRDNSASDGSPIFEGSVNTIPELTTTGRLVLYDALDQPMTGEGYLGDVTGPSDSVAGNLASFADTSGDVLEDSGIAAADVIAALDVLGERTSNLTLFPEYPGAVMTASGSDNDPGEEGMTSDFEAVGTSIYNYYEWSSDVVTDLQSYDINVKIPIPYNFVGIPVGASVALTVDIKTEEVAHTNNLIDITLQRDGNAATSALASQHSAVAETWVTVGFDETGAVLAALVAGDVLNITIRMYSQASKYCRVGKINLQMTVQ